MTSVSRTAENAHGHLTLADVRRLLADAELLSLDENTTLHARVSFGGWVTRLTADPERAPRTARDS